MQDPHHSWHTCDGAGRGATAPLDLAAARVSRRGLVTGLGLGLLSWGSAQSALAQIAIGPQRSTNTVVVVFLRGGADGLSLVPPTFDDDYYRARPILAMRDKDIPMLSDGFGLHPMLQPIHHLFGEGKLAAVHAVGSDDQTRSHFEAMDTMERGVARREGPSTGWVARYLSSSIPENPSPLRGVAFGHVTPTSMVGATNAVTLSSLSDFRLSFSDSTRNALEAMYSPGKDEVAHAGRETLKVLATLDKLDPQRQKALNGAVYPETDLGSGLKQVATLVRAKVGLEIACLDSFTWDTHVAQGTTVGWFPTMVTDLGNSLAAFVKDMGRDMNHVTVVVMSEFGRRIAENTGLGTDHGHGGAMLLMGAGVKGGRVHAKWPGLKDGVGPGDLAVTTDYRDVLSEVLEKRLKGASVPDIFVGHQRSSVGLIV